MKTAIFVFVLMVASALAAPNHEAQELTVKKNAKMLPPKPTKTTTTSTTEKTTSTTEEAISTLPPTIGDYSLVGTYGYYKLHTEYKKTWAEAWLGCIEEDAHLLVIRTQEEYNALYQWKPSEMPPYVYYGAHHNYKNHKFVTIFDEPLESLPYHKFGWDYSNTTFFNNKDFPVMLIDLSISIGSSDIILSSTYNNWYKFICKKDII